MKIVVMLIWAGAAHGGPAMTYGFPTMLDCQRNEQVVKDNFRLIIDGLFISEVKTKCIELNVRSAVNE